MPPYKYEHLGTGDRSPLSCAPPESVSTTEEGITSRRGSHLPWTTSPDRAWTTAWVWLFRIVLLVWMVIVAAASLIVLADLSQSLRRVAVGSDHSGNVPDFPSAVKYFDYIPDFTVDAAEASDAEVDSLQERWSELIPKGRGWTHVTHGLDQLSPPSSDGEGQEVHAIAVFHQIHCLYTIMADYNNAVRNKTTMPAHVRHCFEYLRLTLMCHADTTLEGRPDVIPDTMFQPAVAGSRHACRDYDAVKAWAADHRANEQTGILNVHHHG
ncbi:hypothetical protein PpBr36_02459 [Pyricularia pennisetigena]|uniref:hypothetical protein n=1 Tax=Pyricularia pennisetigena TaxID=1578925 RepID=UPI00114F0C8B|nr:hypothetical protein PpBr36_02459 [Pyricularia pennisetigena]TLS31317.1 hypothetical protein PpBr36_02459 [Pyricularia pennisetigena]